MQEALPESVAAQARDVRRGSAVSSTPTRSSRRGSSTISPSAHRATRCDGAGALPRRPLAEPGPHHPARRRGARPRDGAGDGRAHHDAAREPRQDPRALRRLARLHRAADAGAADERGRAAGRGRRGHPRGRGPRVPGRHGLPLRVDRHLRVHRLGRRGHPVPRQPLHDRGARRRALPARAAGRGEDGAQRARSQDRARLLRLHGRSARGVRDREAARAAPAPANRTA